MTSELILLVDDEPSILALARLYLERENFRVEAVSDGEAALESVNRLSPALKDLTGFENLSGLHTATIRLRTKAGAGWGWHSSRRLSGRLVVK